MDCKNERVSISATDEGGNSVEFNAQLTVIDPKDAIVFECDVTNEETESAFFRNSEIKDLDLSAVEGCGKFVVTGMNDSMAYYMTVSILDTKTPAVDISSFDIYCSAKNRR